MVRRRDHLQGEMFGLLGRPTASMVALLLRRLAGHGGPADRARRLATAGAGYRELVGFLNTHSTLASQFAARTRLEPAWPHLCPTPTNNGTAKANQTTGAETHQHALASSPVRWRCSRATTAWPLRSRPRARNPAHSSIPGCDLGQDRPAMRVDHERVRLHPYLTERMLAEIRDSPKPGRSPSAALTTEDRLLTAADMYHALIEPRRPARAARPRWLPACARMKPGPVGSTGTPSRPRTADGHRAPAQRAFPAGLTPAWGGDCRTALPWTYRTRRSPDDSCSVLRPTPENRLERVYSKLQVSSRAAAPFTRGERRLVGCAPARMNASKSTPLPPAGT